MNRNFIFAIILLTTFSIINAVPHQLHKRATEFKPCPIGGVDSLTVTINPDPAVYERPEIYTVSGTLGEDIIVQKTILEIGYADSSGQPLGDLYTQEFSQSFKAGTPFSITANNVPTPILPSSYFIEVVVGDLTNDPKNPLVVHGCAFAVVKESAESYPITGLPFIERSYPIAERSYPMMLSSKLLNKH
jgi:hypothetical protein